MSEKIVKSGAFEPAISDHKLVYCVLKLKSENFKPIYKDVKMKGQFDQQLFQNTLEQAPWWVSNLSDDVDDITQFWETMYKEIVHDFVNTRKSKVRRRSLPWMNRDIKKLMNQRYKSLQKWQENRENSELRLAYTKLRNKVNAALRLAEASYWREQFENSTTTKEFWQIVGRLKRQTKDTNIAALDDGNGIMKSLDSEKAELLNDYFADIREDLAKNFAERVNGDDNSYISRITPICKEIQTDVKLLNQQIDTLKAEKSMGDDNIAAKELKIAGPSAAPGLTRVIDKSLQDRKYPKQWKKARLKSIF